MQQQITRTSAVERTPRFIQTRDKFSIESDGRSTATWDVDVALPDAWHIGLIVGESGAGKTTLARRLMLDAGGGLLVTPRDADGNLVEPFAWPAGRCVVDGFPESMGINDIVLLLSSVGFSSPPAWLRPFHTLSIGEQFRATVARALAECMHGGERNLSGDGSPAKIDAPDLTPPVVIIDEFANAVDVTAAKVGSAAVAKCVRSLGLRMIAVTTREDVAEWLEPDWVIPMRKGEPVRLVDNRPIAAADSSGREGLRRPVFNRPDLRLEIHRTDRATWALFRHHHYLDHAINKIARCYVGRVDDEPATFTAVIHWPTTKGLVHREHRTVCLPQYQGVGLGNRMSDQIGAAYAAVGRYFSTTSHPALMRSRAASRNWLLKVKPHIHSPRSAGSMTKGRDSTDRVTASFRYVGEPDVELARRLGLRVKA